MTEDETRFFELLDNYSRSRYRCFVSELFLNPEATNYTICFRPADVKKGSQNQSTCAYLRVELAQARIVIQEKTLTSKLIEELDTELGSLEQRAYS
jgi:hypothetical protein